MVRKRLPEFLGMKTVKDILGIFAVIALLPVYLAIYAEFKFEEAISARRKRKRIG